MICTSVSADRVVWREAGRARRIGLEREARQERERLVEEAERQLRQRRKAVALAQRKLDKAHKRAVERAKQMESSSEEVKKKKKKERRAAYSGSEWQ